jgi:hypothetical protein
MKRFTLFIILLMVPGFVFAQQTDIVTTTGNTAKVGQSGANFLQIGVSARSTGFAGAFIGLADDASAAFYNPGALARLSDKSFMFTHTTLPAGLKHFFGSVVLPLGGDLGTIALHSIVLTTGDMPVTKAFIGPTGESFSASEMAVGMSYSRNMTDKFSLGGTLKFIQQGLSGFQARGVGFDFGTMYLVGYRDLKFGMTIRNFGPNMSFGSRSDIGFESQDFNLPMDFRMGASINVIEQENSRFTFLAQLNQPNDNLVNESFGAEYAWMDMVMLRGGYRYAHDGEDFSAGAGLKIPLASSITNFDFSWVRSQDLEDLIRFSFSTSF